MVTCLPSKAYTTCLCSKNISGQIGRILSHCMKLLPARILGAHQQHWPSQAASNFSILVSVNIASLCEPSKANRDEVYSANSKLWTESKFSVVA